MHESTVVTHVGAGRSMLYLDGEQLVDNDGLHGDRERCGARQLAAGLHDVAVCTIYFLHAQCCERVLA
jgi:hypothetical protein